MSKATAIFATAIFALAGLAQAATIEYTVSGWGPTSFPSGITPAPDAAHGPNGYPGDTLALQSYTGTLDLTPGTYEQQINTLLWTIDYTYGGTGIVGQDDEDHWTDLSFNVNAAPTMSFAGGPAGPLAESGLLECTWDNDYLSLSGGPTASFIVGGYEVDVTPLALPETGGSNFDGDNPWSQPSQEVTAQFVVTAIPEPGTLVLLLTAGLGMLACAWRRRRR